MALVSSSTVREAVNNAATSESLLSRVMRTPPTSQSAWISTRTTKPLGQSTPAWFQTTTGSKPRSRSSFWGAAVTTKVSVSPRGGGTWRP